MMHDDDQESGTHGTAGARQLPVMSICPPQVRCYFVYNKSTDQSQGGLAHRVRLCLLTRPYQCLAECRRVLDP